MSASGEASGIEPRVWHVAARGGKQGPLTLTELSGLAARGEISPRSLAWRAGMGSWQPCGLIPELAPVFQAPPPRPPSPPVWLTELRAIVAGLPGLARRVRPHAEALLTRAKSLYARRPRPTRRQWMRAGLVFAVLATYWTWSRFIYTPPHDDFVAQYLGFATGSPQEFIRVEKTDSGYTLAEKAGGRWGGPQPMRPMEEKDLTAVFGDSWSDVKAMGLISASGQTAILRVPLGWESESFTPFSEYFLLKPSGPLDLQKGELKATGLPMLAPKATPESEPEPAVESIPPPKKAKGVQRGVGSVEPPATAERSSMPRLAPSRTKGRAKSRGEVSAGSIREPSPPESYVSAPGPTPAIASTAPMQAAQRESAVPPAESIPQSSFASRPEVASETPAPTPEQSARMTESAHPATQPEAPSAVSAASISAAPSSAAPSSSASKKPSSSAADAQKKAEAARSALEGMSAPGRATLKDQLLKSGDELMKTSRDRAAKGDTDGAIFYAERAEAAYRQGESAFKGGSR